MLACSFSGIPVLALVAENLPLGTTSLEATFGVEVSVSDCFARHVACVDDGAVVEDRDRDVQEVWATLSRIAVSCEELAPVGNVVRPVGADSMAKASDLNTSRLK